MSRTVEEIKADIENVSATGTQKQLDLVWLEWFRVAANDIEPERLVEICQAERENRLVVLSTPMKPLLISDDPMDSDVYCPECGKTLSGAWPDSVDCDWNLCQCFYCGQSIDDTKVLTKTEAEKALEKLKEGEADV